MILKKTAAILTSLLIMASAFPTGSVSTLALTAEQDSNTASEHYSADSEAHISFSKPDFRSIRGQEVNEIKDIVAAAAYTPIEKNISLIDRADELPSAFDMREEGMITSVKNQNPFGTCWTFASAVSAETSLMKYIPSINLSEMHSAVMAHYGDSAVNDNGIDTTESILDYGGTCFVVTNLWAQWNGAIDEEKLGYTNSGMFSDESCMKLNEAFASEFEYLSDYHLENAYMFDYNSDGSNRDEINGLIKQFLYSGHAVDVSYLTNGYSYSTNASYSTGKPTEANHSVAIVGWDDDFTAVNFKGNKGAWLIKNSWGSHFGDNGYFWVSYADTTLCEFAVYDITDNTNYTTNYQHDTFVPGQRMCADENMDVNQPSYMANVFIAEQTEQIEAVSTYIGTPGTEYEITVYTGLEDISDPVSGTASAVTKGSSELTGYMTIDLDENVIVDSGENFSVVVKMYCDDNKYVIPLETCTFLENKETGSIDDSSELISGYSSYEQISKMTGKNESFYSEDGTSWIDVTSESYTYSDEDKMLYLESLISEYDDIFSENQKEEARAAFEEASLRVIMGNISLKAFGNPVNTVDFSHISGNVPLDEKVELSVKDESDIYYSVNGSDYILYDAASPIEISEEMTVSATTDNIHFTEKTYRPAKAEFSDLMYSTVSGGVKSKDAVSAERIDSDTYIMTLNGSEEAISFLPISSAEIRCNGEVLKSGSFTENFSLKEGTNTFEFELIQENRISSVVTVKVVTPYVSFDLESETVSFRGIDVLKAADGHTFKSGDSVADYAGRTLIVMSDGETSTVTVPSRAELPKLELDYYNETLNFIPNDIADNVVYAVNGNPDAEDYISAEGRLIDGQNITSGMVMNKAFRIIPGETITLKIKPAEGMFGSKEKVFVIPQAGTAPKPNPEYSVIGEQYVIEYSDTIEYGVIDLPLTDNELAKKAKAFGYDSKTYSQLMMKRYGVSDKTELMKLLAVEWDSVYRIDIENKKSAEIAMRYYSIEDGFASKAVFAELRYLVRGDVDADGAIDASDASFVLAYYAAASTGNAPDLSKEQRYCCDYDNDGHIDAYDASQILKYYAMKSTGQI